MERIKEQQRKMIQSYNEREGIYHLIVQKTGLTEISYRILYAICEDEKKYSQIDISRMWNYPKQSVNSAITKLLKLEYITLIPDKTAKNRKIIELTDRGKTFCDSWVCPVVKADFEAFAFLTEEERVLYINLIEKQCKIIKSNLSKLLEM